MIKFTKRTWNLKISGRVIKIMAISNRTGHTVYNAAERASESWLCTKPRFESHVYLSFGLLAWPIGIKVGPTRWADFASFIRPYGGSWHRIRQTSKISREIDEAQALSFQNIISSRAPVVAVTANLRPLDTKTATWILCTVNF